MAQLPNEKPSRNEDEYFVKDDAELIKQMRAKLDEEKEKSARSVHFMKCPKCGADLKEEKFGEVSVDVCPDCNGMWLDAGELEVLRQAPRGGGVMNDFLDFFQRRK
jgi:uncharacterized protein